MNDVELLLKEEMKIPVKVQGEEIKVGRLSFLQVTKVMKELGRIFIANSAKFKNIKADGANNIEDIISILEQFDENEIVKLISIVIRKDVSFCSKLSAVEVSEIIRATIEINYDEFQATLKNWKGTARKIKIENQEKK